MCKVLKIAVFLLVFASLACNRSEAQTAQPAGAAVYQRISASEANRMMQELTDFILLDVRTEGEFRRRRIEGAILIPDTEIQRRAVRELPDKSRVILVYCQGGVRSERAARALINMGYLNVFDFGGIASWPYETVSN